MGRLRLSLVTLLALLGPPALAGAAELTRVLSIEPDDPFALSLSVRWDRAQERALISRERPSGVASAPVRDAPALRYTRTKNDVVSRLALALYQDLELHAELPYALADDVSWRYGIENGFSTAPANNMTTPGIDAMGRACGTDADSAAPGVQCPLFPVPLEVFHGGRLGDVSAGLAWAIFNDARDDTKATWVVGVDATFPTAARYDPAQGRWTNWQSPYWLDSKRGPSGEKVWRWDFYTAMSRRLGPAEPYFKIHVTGMTKSNQTYSNCEHVSELAQATPAQMTLAAVQNCNTGKWKSDSGAQLPFLAGMTLGTELVPFEDLKEEQRIAIDLRAFGDYTSRARFYNELTHMSGKLHMTDGYLTIGGRLGLSFKASRYVALHAGAAFATRTAHWLSGESLGKNRGEIPAGDVTGALNGAGGTCDPTGARSCNPDLNPNFDWRYDAPGRRFRISEVYDFSMSVSGVVSF